MSILIVNPNPVFDRTITLEELVPGAVMRTLDIELTAGGKGINVARVLRSLGISPKLVIPVGVDDRVRYVELLRVEGASPTIVDVPGSVRTASIYLEERSARVTVVNDVGTPMSEKYWEKVRAAVRTAIASGDVVLCMGSFPPGLNPSSLSDLIEDVHAAGAAILIDTNPHWLAASLSSAPDVVTPNVHEAEAALGLGTAHVMDADDSDAQQIRARAEAAALELCVRGAVRAFVTGGSAGVAVARPGSVTWLPSYPVEAVSTVGAGDSFVAGVAYEWACVQAGEPNTSPQETDWIDAVEFGIATAAASCEHVRAGGIIPARVHEIHAALKAEAR